MPRMIATHERAPAATPLAHDVPPPWRAVAAGPVVAAVTLVTALIVTSEARVPLRDPDGVSLRRFVIAAALVALLVGGDIAFRAGRARWTAARAEQRPCRVQTMRSPKGALPGSGGRCDARAQHGSHLGRTVART